MRPARIRLPGRWPALAAALLAFMSAAVSLYWTLGGTALLDTVGGAIEELARERSPGALALGAVTVLVKATAGLLALALAQPKLTRLGQRAVLVANGVASAVLILWGGANVIVGGLVLGDIIALSTSVDERALRWHVFLWDLWFLVWGLVLAVAVARRRRPTR